MTTREKILSSLKLVLVEPKFVKIDAHATEHFAEILSKEPLPPWDNNLQFLSTPEETIHYYFFVDSINFCFWALKGKERWSREVNGVWMNGYYAYSSAIKDAFLKDKKLFDSTYLSTISEANFKNIFQGKNELLLMDKRLAIIRENFSILLKEFRGNASALVESAGRDADALVENILRLFPSFRDQAQGGGAELYFLKRAQIFVSDLSFALPEYPPTQFSNLGNLTALADYKLPQIFESLGIFIYDENLKKKIIAEELIPAGSQEEVEIRASTIIVIELLRKMLNKKGKEVTATQVDWMVWVKAKQTVLPTIHHKTLSTFY